MFSNRSIRQRFLVQLIFASASLIFIFSSLSYFFIERSIYEDKHQELLNYAKNIAQNKSMFDGGQVAPELYIGINVEVINLNKNLTPDEFGFLQIHHT